MRLVMMRIISKSTWQFLEQEGRLGWDHRAVSKLRAEPELKFVKQNVKGTLMGCNKR